MSLVFSAIVPHPPILIPTIGKEHIKEIDNTVKAMKELEQRLYTAKPDVILIISPHGTILPDAFTANLNPTYKANFEQFGDMSTKLEFKSSPMLIDKFNEDAEDCEIPLTMITEENIDHGAAVPLYYLTQHLPDIKIIPMGYSMMDFKAHLDFGECLKNAIVNENKRIAVIASGDLSHRLTKDAPAGYSEKGKEFDEKMIELIKNKDIDGMVNLDPKLVEEAGECGLRSFLILLGIISRMQYEPEILSYEGPFGVGYMVAHFKTK